MSEHKPVFSKDANEYEERGFVVRGQGQGQNYGVYAYAQHSLVEVAGHLMFGEAHQLADQLNATANEFFGALPAEPRKTFDLILSPQPETFIGKVNMALASGYELHGPTFIRETAQPHQLPTFVQAIVQKPSKA